MNGIGWITVAEAARLCGTDELCITLWMNGKPHRLRPFRRHPDDRRRIPCRPVQPQPGRHHLRGRGATAGQARQTGQLRRLLDTPLDTFGLSQRIVRACRELGVFTVEHLLVHLRRFRFSRLYCVRNFGSGSAAETLRRLRQDGLTDGGSPRISRSCTRNPGNIHYLYQPII